MRRKQQIWSIGMCVGSSPCELVPQSAPFAPVFTARHVKDLPALYVAGPFMVREGETWHMFFEVLNRTTQKREIGVAVSNDGTDWQYRQIVLAEPFDVSYPYVFEADGSFYMVPQTQTRSVRLYRAVDFPNQWTLAATLLEDQRFVDSSVFRYHDRWWMFTETSEDMRHDTLRLYSADRLEGPWREHPESPIVSGDARIARPAGRVVVAGDVVIRYAQDCQQAYGERVRAFVVSELTATRYREREADQSVVLAGTGTGWNAFGMHHVDPHQMNDGTWIACVDGWTYGEVWLLEQISVLLRATFDLPPSVQPFEKGASLAGLGIGVDSFDAFRLVAALEQHFDIAVDESALTPATLENVKSLISLVRRNL